MTRYARPTASSYSFGPGPITPAVKWIIWANVGAFVATIIFPVITPYLGLIPQAVFERRGSGSRSPTCSSTRASRTSCSTCSASGCSASSSSGCGARTFFVRYYAITGIGAAITTLLVALLPFDFAAETYKAVTIGASGALYGLLLAFAMYFPNRPILMFLLFPVPAKYFVIIIGAISFLSATGGGTPTVAHAAHLGGHDLRVPLPQGRRRRAHGGDQIPLPEMEDEPAAAQVRRVLGRPVRLGPQVH